MLPHNVMVKVRCTGKLVQCHVVALLFLGVVGKVCQKFRITFGVTNQVIITLTLGWALAL